MQRLPALPSRSQLLLQQQQRPGFVQHSVSSSGSSTVRSICSSVGAPLAPQQQQQQQCQAAAHAQPQHALGNGSSSGSSSRRLRLAPVAATFAAGGDDGMYDKSPQVGLQIL
jgi:hypothetical protein